MGPLGVVALLVSCLPLAAQNISASLSGTVQDSLGGAFPGASVKATGANNGFIRTTLTNNEGFFSFPDLQPGIYTLTVTAAGFKQYQQTGIELSSGDQKSLGRIGLEIGTVSESVTVTAEAVAVQLGSGEKSGVLTSADLENMALRGRDLMDAVGLLPGVVDLSDSRDAPNPSSIGNLFIMGGRSNSKNMTIDGVTNLDTGSNGSVHSMPSMDSVGEVKVLMSAFAAENGRNSGGSITILTKGGGKEFHGSAGWYNRHEDYSANDYFNNRNGIPRQPYRYNIASYTIGGPAFIPKFFNTSRSKLFFFFSQEFQEQKVNVPSKTVTVPTALERAGDYSQTFDLNARLVTIYDPLNNQKAFPGNVIPKSRIDPLGEKILNLFPLPNFVDPVASRRYQWNYISALSGAYPRRTEIVRIDFAAAKNMQIFARLSNNADEQHPPYGQWVNGSVNYPLTPIVFGAPGRGATVNTTATITPTTFNEFIFGVSQNKLRYYPEFPDKVSKAATGVNVPQWNPELNPTGFIPNMTFSSVNNYANPSLSNGVPYYNSNTIFSFVDNVSHIRGTHMLKAGVYVERTRKDQSASVATRGQIAFDRDRNNPLDTNYAYSNALIGVFDNYQEATARPQGQFRFTNLEWYVQDAWRIKPRLLLDYGIRFYRDMPQYDARRQLSSFVPGLFDPANAPVLLRPGYDPTGKKAAIDPVSGIAYPDALIGTYAPGHGDPSDGMAIGGLNGYPTGLYRIPAVSVAPRFGFAYDPIGKGKTAIRGGIGVYYDRIQGNPTMGTLSNPPTIYTPTIYYGTLADLQATAGQGILAPSNVTSLLGTQKAPTVYNFNIGWQQQFGHSLLMDLSYGGSISRHFLWERNINPVPIDANHLENNPGNKDPTAPTRPLPRNFLRPYQGYGDILLFEFASTSSYNSLQYSITKRMRQGNLGVSYTFSKTLGSANSDTTQVSAFFDPRKWNYGPLQFDRTHVLSFRYNYAFGRPGKRLQSRLLSAFADGWEISGITRIQSGEPFTPGFSTTDGTDITGTPTEGARIQVKDPAADPRQMFTRPAKYTFGNAGVGILKRPGVNNWDASLYRTFRLAERKTAQFRFESYNTFNHTQFSSIDTTARFDPQGNQINAQFLDPTAARSPRRIQLAMRFNW